MGLAERDIVYRLDPDPAFAVWRLATPCGLDVDRIVADDADKLDLRRDDDARPLGDLSLLPGLGGCLLVAPDFETNPALHFYATVAGDLFDLSGEAEGFMLFRPTLHRILDDSSVDRYDFIAERLGIRLFRSTPIRDQVFCFTAAEHDGGVEDIEDYANMEFRKWTIKSGLTGVSLTPIWIDGKQVAPVAGDT